jgi:hypothetical protein
MLHNGYLHSTGTDTSIQSLVRLPWNLFVTYRFGSPIGPLFLALAPLALVARKERSLTILLVAYAALSSVLWFYLTQQPRFLSSTLLVFALLAGAGADALLRSAGHFRRAVLSIILTGWLVTQWPLTVNPAALGASWPYIRGATPRADYLASRIDTFPVFEFANSHLPPGSLIFLLLYENRGFYLDVPYFWANPIVQRVVRFEQIPSDGELYRQLRQMGFTHVIVNPNLDFPDEPYASHFHELVSDLTRDHLTQIFTENGVALYALDR